ncbi:hypothetical protein FET57_09600 [Campylobacter coli]|nr:hypothetical protein [Campylobacter coli]
MKPLEKVLDERKRQKQEKENDNANNTRSNSTGIVRENDKTEPREISQFFTKLSFRESKKIIS